MSVNNPLMPPDHYVAGLDALVSVCRVLMTLPLAEMQEHNAYAEALAPIMEPTAYRDGGLDNLRDQRKIIAAAVALQRVCQSLEPQP